MECPKNEGTLMLSSLLAFSLVKLGFYCSVGAEDIGARLGGGVVTYMISSSMAVNTAMVTGNLPKGCC